MWLWKLWNLLVLQAKSSFFTLQARNFTFQHFSFAIGRTEVTSRVEEVPIDDTMLSEICPDAGKQKKISTLTKIVK